MCAEGRYNNSALLPLALLNVPRLAACSSERSAIAAVQQRFTRRRTSSVIGRAFRAFKGFFPPLFLHLDKIHRPSDPAAAPPVVLCREYHCYNGRREETHRQRVRGADAGVRGHPGRHRGHHQQHQLRQGNKDKRPLLSPAASSDPLCTLSRDAIFVLSYPFK